MKKTHFGLIHYYLFFYFTRPLCPNWNSLYNIAQCYRICWQADNTLQEKNPPLRLLKSLCSFSLHCCSLLLTSLYPTPSLPGLTWSSEEVARIRWPLRKKKTVQILEWALLHWFPLWAGYAKFYTFLCAHFPLLSPTCMASFRFRHILKKK